MMLKYPLEEHNIIEITLGTTPRNPRFHTKGFLHHTKTLVFSENFFNSFIDSQRLNATIYMCLFLGTQYYWKLELPPNKW